MVGVSHILIQATWALCRLVRERETDNHLLLHKPSGLNVQLRLWSQIVVRNLKLFDRRCFLWVECHCHNFLFFPLFHCPAVWLVYNYVHVGLETRGNPRLWVRIPAPTESPRLLPGRCTVGCPLLQVCTLGWVKCREHISLLIILCIIVYVTNKAHPSLICIVLHTNNFVISVCDDSYNIKIDSRIALLYLHLCCHPVIG